MSSFHVFSALWSCSISMATTDRVMILFATIIDVLSIHLRGYCGIFDLAEGVILTVTTYGNEIFFYIE